MDWSAGKIGTINQRSARANGLSAPPIGSVLHLLGLPSGGNKVYDQSPYGNSGTIIGATWKRLPSGLWCLDFDGVDDNITITHNTILNFDDEITIELWIYSASDVANAAYVINKGGNFAILPHYENCCLYSTLDGNWQKIVDAGGAAAKSAWVHLAVTYDAGDTGDAAFYKNGAVGNTASGKDGTITTNTTAIKVGVDGSYKGYIALPRIYNRALSALEIQNSFNREKHLFGVW